MQYKLKIGQTKQEEPVVKNKDEEAKTLYDEELRAK
jgi:hypothetical protein